MDVTKLPVTKKRVRPIEKQGPTESRSEQWLDFKIKMFWGMTPKPDSVGAGVVLRN